MVRAGEDGSQSEGQTGQAPDAAPSTPCIHPSTPSAIAHDHGVPMEQDYDEEEEEDDDDEKEQEEADLGRIGR